MKCSKDPFIIVIVVNTFTRPCPWSQFSSQQITTRRPSFWYWSEVRYAEKSPSRISFRISSTEQGVRRDPEQPWEGSSASGSPTLTSGWHYMPRPGDWLVPETASLRWTAVRRWETPPTRSWATEDTPITFDKDWHQSSAILWLQWRTLAGRWRLTLPGHDCTSNQAERTETGHYHELRRGERDQIHSWQIQESTDAIDGRQAMCAIALTNDWQDIIARSVYSCFVFQFRLVWLPCMFDITCGVGCWYVFYMLAFYCAAYVIS